MTDSELSNLASSLLEKQHILLLLKAAVRDSSRDAKVAELQKFKDTVSEILEVPLALMRVAGPPYKMTLSAGAVHALVAVILEDFPEPKWICKCGLKSAVLHDGPCPACGTGEALTRIEP